MKFKKIKLKESYNGCTHAIAVALPLSGVSHRSIEFNLLNADGDIVGGLAVAQYDPKLVTNRTTCAKLITIINDAIQAEVQSQIDASNANNLVVEKTTKTKL